MERDFNNELNECDEYEVKFQECIARLGSRSNNTSVNRNNSNPNSSEQLRTLLKCPVAPLPTFSSGDGEDLSKFFRNFEDTIVRFNYPDYDKLLLLKQQVTGRAAILLSSLESDKQSCESAKKLLSDALASPAIQKFNLIKN